MRLAESALRADSNIRRYRSIHCNITAQERSIPPSLLLWSSSWSRTMRCAGCCCSMHFSRPDPRIWIRIYMQYLLNHVWHMAHTFLMAESKRAIAQCELTWVRFLPSLEEQYSLYVVRLYSSVQLGSNEPRHCVVVRARMSICSVYMMIAPSSSSCCGAGASGWCGGVVVLVFLHNFFGQEVFHAKSSLLLLPLSWWCGAMMILHQGRPGCEAFLVAGVLSPNHNKIQNAQHNQIQSWFIATLTYSPPPHPQLPLNYTRTCICKEYVYIVKVVLWPSAAVQDGL